jgi:hypothetical protein
MYVSLKPDILPLDTFNPPRACRKAKRACLISPAPDIPSTSFVAIGDIEDGKASHYLAVYEVAEGEDGDRDFTSHSLKTVAPQVKTVLKIA